MWTYDPLAYQEHNLALLERKKRKFYTQIFALLGGSNFPTLSIVKVLHAQH